MLKIAVFFVSVGVVMACRSHDNRIVKSAESVVSKPAEKESIPGPAKTMVADAAPILSEPEKLLAAESAAYKNAAPVFSEYCSHCHTSTKKITKTQKKAMSHFDMDQYPFTGHHAHELGHVIRNALGVDGSKVTMPKDDKGAVTGEQLKLVVAWSHAYDALKQSDTNSHEQGHHEHQ